MRLLKCLCNEFFHKLLFDDSINIQNDYTFTIQFAPNDSD
jgi:hypothetical protein